MHCKLTESESRKRKWSRLLTRLVAICLLLLSAGTGAETYEYDNAGRLVQVTYDDGFVIVYTYDASGNIVSRQKSRTENIFASGFE